MAKINIQIDPDQLAETKAKLAELYMLVTQIEASLVHIKTLLGIVDGDK